MSAPLTRLRGRKPVRWNTLLGLVLVPLTIAGVFIWGLWNPTERLDTVTAAVVNHDEPVEVEGQLVPLGRVLAGELIGDAKAGDAPADDADGSGDDDAPVNFTWVLTNEEDAQEGLDDGRYMSVVTIPENFSAAATSLSDGPDAARQAHIDIAESDRGRLLDTALSGIVTQTATSVLNQQLGEQFVGTVFVGMNELHSGIGEAADGAAQLASGGSQLASGASELADGASQLADGTGQLADGAGQLSTGVGQLSVGAGELANGTGQLAAGAGELASGTGQVVVGASELADGAGQLTGGASELATGAGQLASGVGELANGSGQLATGASELADGTSQLATGVSQYADGANSLAQSYGDLQVGATAALEQLKAIIGELGQIEGQAGAAQADLAEGLTTAGTATDQFGGSVEQTVADCFAAGATQEFCDSLGTSLSDHAASIGGGLSTAQAGAESLGAVMSGLEGALGGGATDGDPVAQLDQLIAGLAEFGSGLNTFAASGGELATGASDLAAGSSQLSSGVGELSAGAGALAAGTSELSAGASQLAAGTSGLSEGASQLAGGTSQLAGGASELAVGTSELAGGAGALASGVGALAEGASQLAAGTSELAANTPELAEGASQLADGTEQAAEGASELAGGLDEAATGIPNYTESERDKLAETAIAPVEARGGSDQLFTSSGVALFAGIALWAGALALFLVLAPLWSRTRDAARGVGWITLRSALPAVTLGAVQGVIAGIVLPIALGYDFSRSAAFFGIALLAGIAFALMVQGLSALLGGTGRFIAFALLVVVFAVGVVSTVPGPLVAVGDASPVGAALAGFQVVAAGAGAGGVGGAAALLALWGLGGLALTALAVVRTRSRPA